MRPMPVDPQDQERSEPLPAPDVRSSLERIASEDGPLIDRLGSA